jgi:phospholipid/cholesterol/gamma-HCH transport system substrate-binding protein
MRNTLETRLGMFFALALVVAIIIMELVGTFDYFKRGVRVSAAFDSVKELKVGDPVRLAGFNIGRVERLGPDATEPKIVVHMKLDAEQAARVRTDSRATIQFTGLMGQNFVALSFGSPDAPAIDPSKPTMLLTDPQPDLSMLMSKLDTAAEGIQRLTQSLKPDTLQNLVGPLNDFLRDNSPRISGILSNTESVTAQVAQQVRNGEGTVGKLIQDAALYNTALAAVSNLTATAGKIDATLADARSVISKVNEGEGTLGMLLTDKTLYGETTQAMTNLHGILKKINVGQGSVGLLVNDEAFYRNMKVSLQKLDKAAESLEDQGPVSVLGIAVGSLF